MNVLVIDIGGTTVKMRVSGNTERRTFESGPALTPGLMTHRAQEITQDWSYDAVSIGYPGPVRDGRPHVEPNNLAPGWTSYDFQQALGLPVRILNDAAMQALGSHTPGGGILLFLGLGTGLGSALVTDFGVIPLELGELPYKEGNYEDYLGLCGMEKNGINAWRQDVAEVAALFRFAFQTDEIVLGGGNATNINPLPPGCRRGSNDHAFTGGFRMWGTEE